MKDPSPCHRTDSSVRFLRTGKTCRYHRKRDKSGFRQSYPENFCASAYHAAYPFCLSLLYTSGKPRRRELLCPRGSVRLSISEDRVLPQWLSPFTAIILRMARFLLRRSVEVPGKRIFIKTASIKGECPAGLKLDERFLFNIRDRRIHCPAGFYNIYPFLRRAGKKTPRTITVVCPDSEGVSYSFVGNGFGDCSSPALTAGLPRPIAVRIPGLCPTALHSVLPYLLTLSEGGVFGWLAKGESVRVRCPRPDGIVMEIPDAVTVRVVERSGSCPAGHKPGAVFIVGPRAD